MNLTDEEIRIKVAEACGWSNMSHHKIHAGNEGLIGSHIAKDGVPSRDWVPNYPEDLNAMHEAEKVFTEGQMGAYAYVLLETTGFREKSGVWLFHATARQRCIAYLRVKGILP